MKRQFEESKQKKRGKEGGKRVKYNVTMWLVSSRYLRAYPQATIKGCVELVWLLMIRYTFELFPGFYRCLHWFPLQLFRVHLTGRSRKNWNSLDCTCLGKHYGILSRPAFPQVMDHFSVFYQNQWYSTWWQKSMASTMYGTTNRFCRKQWHDIQLKIRRMPGKIYGPLYWRDLCKLHIILKRCPHK